MALFALPKTLTDLVKAFKSAAAGRVLRKGPAGWEFVNEDTPEFRAANPLRGVTVTTIEPPLIPYTQWVSTGEGYWAWVDVSSAAGSTEVASSGGAVLSGSSATISGSAPVSSGGAVLSGSPLISCGVLTAGSGGPVLSGTATVSMGSAGSVIVSSMGGIVSGGVSVTLRGVVALPAGGAVLSGSAGTIRGTSALSSGGPVPGGAALSAKGSMIASAGGAILSGTASVAGAAGAASTTVTSAGGAVLSGSAAQVVGRVSATSGGAVVSGAAAVLGTASASAPTQPVISATGGDTTVTIAKTSGGTGATSYDLKWGTAAGSRPNTISGVTLPYTHTGRTNGTTYYYSLVATNAQGSTESAEVSAAAVVYVPGAPVTLAFESATITDSSGATWEKVVPSAVAGGVAGVITSGVPGISGADGNCLSIKQSLYDDGSDYYNLDTFIRRTMNVAAGTISIRVMRGNNSSAGKGYVKVGSTKYDLGLTTLGAFVDKTITIPSAQTNVVVEIGFQFGTAYIDNYIESVSIPQ